MAASPRHQSHGCKGQWLRGLPAVSALSHRRSGQAARCPVLQKHLLCPLCAIRRGAKALAAYLARWEAIKLQNPRLQPYLVTLTVKDGDDLAERFKHLHDSQRELWKRKQRGRGSVLDDVEGAVWSYEVKRGSGSGAWHPHLHMIALCEAQPDAQQLATEWHAITGDSFIVDVRPISQDDPRFRLHRGLQVRRQVQRSGGRRHRSRLGNAQGKRLLASSGCFRGVVVPDELTDDSSDLAGLPYMDMLYRFTRAGYTLETVMAGIQQPRKAPKTGPAPFPLTDERRGLYERFRRVYLERLDQRGIRPGPKLIPLESPRIVLSQPDPRDVPALGPPTPPARPSNHFHQLTLPCPFGAVHTPPCIPRGGVFLLLRPSMRA